MVHKKEKLTKKEEDAQSNFLLKIKFGERKTKKPLIVAMIGLSGSGKSSVSKELSELIGAVIISGDDIRVELRKQGERYDRARFLAENVAIEAVKCGSNVILDSDFIDVKKRASLREKARKAGANLVFICTYADLDVMLGRIITAGYSHGQNDFFGGASCVWDGDQKVRGAIVKTREMFRRTPHHYRWVNKSGGKWEIKNPPCKVFADIDTTNVDEWKREVGEFAKRLIKQY